ncbi:Hypothetical protein NTJ_14020 [Nesidiocoris tenuis]|uniref:Uncharacterized protein n=1 Tax=Nesidiocoris tenuis TaxID=355587 RepID=A0ABN7B9Z3_9HEMI|nr:Hypothetical protein NTJ_14020 [Nesidiocoris tenuis]
MSGHNTSSRDSQQSALSSKRNREQRSPQADSEAKKTRTPCSEMAQVTQKSLDDLYERIMMGVNTAMRTELASFATKVEINQLVEKVEALAKENTGLRAEIADLRKENAGLRNAVDDLEVKFRSRRLVVRGLDTSKEADAKTAVERFFADLLGTPAISVGINQVFAGASPRPTLLIELASDRDVFRVLAGSGKLRGSGVSVTRDLPPETRKRANRMLRLRWEVRRLCPQAKVVLRTDRLWVNNRRFSWLGDSLVCEGASGVDALFEATGVDFAGAIRDIVSFKRPPDAV